MCGGVSHRTKGSREQGRDSPPTRGGGGGGGGGGGQEEEETRVDGKASIIESVPSSVEPDPDNTIILSASQLARTRAIEWRVLYFRFSAQAGIRRKKRWEVKKIKK